MKRADNIKEIVNFIPAGREKKDIFKGEHFNIVVITLDNGVEIAPHDEPYDVFFYVISGKGSFTAGQQQWEAEAGSTVFAPKGIRGIKCIERMTILGVK